MSRCRALLVAALLAACSREHPASPPVVGEGRLAVPGGSIWYKVSGTGAGTPLVLLHGGPGFPSYYLKPFEALGDDRPVIRYDQLGAGKSGATTDTTLFTIPHFVAELDSLRIALGVSRWDVLGHSWGSILAVEYYRAHPDRVRALVLASPVLDIPAFEQRARSLVFTLSDSAQQAIAAAETNGDYASSGYQAAMNEFYGLYVWRRPQQPDLDSAMAQFNQAVYTYMQGPSEFTITGTLKGWTALPWLGTIAAPTLFTVGEFDEVGPELVRQHASLVPGARYELLAGSAHLTPWDAREDNVRAVREFLRGVDSTPSAPSH
ncbi:MAG TPA: proline iminopeptidase-family hydrolase [Gemmatimonadales bacterium]|nr:proline iminopeptidase-family hydrolase [Gemmatimonadales bacterium]